MADPRDIDALRSFFRDLPAAAKAGVSSTAGTTIGQTEGNPDILKGPVRKKRFPDKQNYDAYIADTGLDDDATIEYRYTVYNDDGSVTLYIEG